MANDDPLMSQDEIERLFSQPKEPAAPAKTSPAAPTGVGRTDDQPLAQNDIEQMLGDASTGGPAVAVAGPAKAPSARAAAPQPREPDIATQDIEYLLAQAEKALESVNSSRLG